MAAPPPRRTPPRTRAPVPQPTGPRVRRGTVRLPDDVAWRVRAGHPWIFRDALGGRPLREAAGDSVDVVDETGAFVARGLYDPAGVIAIRVYTRDPDVTLDALTIGRLVDDARARRARLLPPGLDARRVVHGEGDGLPGV